MREKENLIKLVRRQEEEKLHLFLQVQFGIIFSFDSGRALYLQFWDACLSPKLSKIFVLGLSLSLILVPLGYSEMLGNLGLT